MFEARVALGVALLCGVARLASPFDHCTELAAGHSSRYELALDRETKFRAVKIAGRPTRVVVWGEGRSSPAAAAAALLLVALRHGLGYDAELRLEPFDVCSDNSMRLSVAPAALVTPCPNRLYGPEPLDTFIAEDSAASIPLRAPLLARAPAHCAGAGGVLHAYDGQSLRSCASSLTLLEFRKLKLELPSCPFDVRSCTTSEDGSAHVILVTATTPLYEMNKLKNYICKNNLPLIFLQFNNISCFRRTLSKLYYDNANLSFLFLDRDLWMYNRELLSVILKEDKNDGCPSRNLNNITDFVHRIGDGKRMKKYAPQIADVVEKFCPSLYHLKEILDNQTGDVFSIEKAACKWALENNDTFKLWISNKWREYVLYCYFCASNELNKEYIKIIREIKRTAMKHHDFDIRVLVHHLDCNSHQNMTHYFIDMTKRRPPHNVMGVIAWSSSEGIKDIAIRANDNQVPLILIGPISPDIPMGPASTAIDGRLDDLTSFYRAFLYNCGWTRFAILSDGSTYANDFTNCLLHGDDFNYIETTVTSETVKNVLKSLRENEARVFIVNTNTSIAAEILRSALTLGMSPPKYVWILREWSLTKDRTASADWGDMSHFSLGTAWRGAGGDVMGSDSSIRAQLHSLWPEAAWPALAAPLADAMLLLDHSFNKFQQLYSRNSYSMRHLEYVMNFSQIYNRITLAGVARKLSFQNGTVETVKVYLERWHGATRSVLGAWDLRHVPHREFWNETLCGVRVRDRSPCSFPAGGKAFVEPCYDIPIYSLFAVLGLLPLVFVVARRARLKRLAVRDLNLQAHILGNQQLTSIVHKDSLYIHEEIGTGNFGKVYLATLRLSNEKVIQVAAKVLRDESDKEEYLQEAGTLQQLDHENIVKFLGICVFSGSLLILMEYAQHSDLLQYLREQRHLTACALTQLAREAAAALDYLARCKLVHRDVRAANCLVDEHCTLKLADFGLARKLCDNLEYTSIRCFKLPVLWMAPEGLSGSFSTASDVWSLGVLILELVTRGGRPYGACHPHQVMTHVRLGGYPPLPPDASLQTVSLVRACWQYKAEERATAGDVERYLARKPHALRPTVVPAPAIGPHITDDLQQSPPSVL